LVSDRERSLPHPLAPSSSKRASAQATRPRCRCLAMSRRRAAATRFLVAPPCTTARPTCCCAALAPASRGQMCASSTRASPSRPFPLRRGQAPPCSAAESPAWRAVGFRLATGVAASPDCNALNLGVEFFSSFPSPNSGVTLSFSLFSSLNLDLFQSYSGIRLEIPCKAKP
jgi:hypothetical protein